jgi:hypothetical protein
MAIAKKAVKKAAKKTAPKRKPDSGGLSVESLRNLSSVDRSLYLSMAMEVLMTPVSQGLAKLESREDELSPLEIGVMKLARAVMTEENDRPLTFAHRYIIEPLSKASRRQRAAMQLETAMQPMSAKMKDREYTLEEVVEWFAHNVHIFSDDRDILEMFISVTKSIAEIAHKSKQLDVQREILAYSRINAIPIDKLNNVIFMIQEAMKKHLAGDPEKLQSMAEEIYGGLRTVFPAFAGSEQQAIEGE